FFFFFQAEDGIRDFHVTGVQTCALPIFSHARSIMALRRASFSHVNSSSVFVSASVYGRPCRRVWCRTGSPAESIWVCTCRRPARSEERRVGKEWRWRWGPEG